MLSLATSIARLVVIAVPLVFLAKMQGFRLEWIWWLSVFAVTLQMVLNLVLLRREFARRLHVAPAVAA